MKEKICTNCGRALTKKTTVMLELSLTDGNYYENIPEGHESQGFFSFGPGCAISVLKKTEDSIIESFHRDLDKQIELQNFFDR